MSTDDQNLALQLDALRKAEVDEVFEGRISGETTSRPALGRLLPQLRRGDTLAVWKLDRLGRGVLHLVALMEESRARGVEFRSLTEGVDTRTVVGRAMFQPVAVSADLERGQNHERIVAGIAAARSAGVHCGRRRSMSPAHVDDAWAKIAEGCSRARAESSTASRGRPCMRRSARTTSARRLRERAGAARAGQGAAAKGGSAVGSLMSARPRGDHTRAGEMP